MLSAINGTKQYINVPKVLCFLVLVLAVNVKSTKYILKMPTDRLAALRAAQIHSYDLGPEDSVELNGGKLDYFLQVVEEMYVNIDKVQNNIDDVMRIHSAILSVSKTDEKVLVGLTLNGASIWPQL